jgi:hypothetical protein
MTSTIILGVLKVFEKLEYALAFRRGQLYMNTLAHFRGYEDTPGEQRGDSYEGASGVFQPSGLGPIKVGEIEIPPAELAGPLLVHRREVEMWNVFCMYSLNTGGLGEGVSRETLADVNAKLQLHEKCHGLGEHVVAVTNFLQFRDRVSAAITKSGMGGAMALVRYYDDETFHGPFEPNLIPFQKRKQYAHQREYRVVVHRQQRVSTPLILEIGDISDITLLTTTKELKIEMRLPEESDV